MTLLESGRTILVSVEDPAAARVVRGILQSLRDEPKFFFLLAHEGLLNLLGDVQHPHGFDAQACMLNPERFGLVITFGSIRAGGAGTASSWLVSYFEEVGIPTIEIQRQLFQEGCYPLSPGNDSFGTSQAPNGSVVLWRYAARTLLTWGGPGGIGYPRQSFDSYELPVRSDLISVTSSLESSWHSERDRYRFAIAVLKVAMAHPELSFCWIVRAEEVRSDQAAPMLKMITDAALPNLWLEFSESAQSVIRRSQFGIAMPSTALLDYQCEGKPVLLYACALRDAMGAAGSSTPFANYFELESLLEQVGTTPAAHAVEMDVPNFEPERFLDHLQTWMAQASLSPAWFQIVPKYLAQLQLLAVLDRPVARREQADDVAIDKLSGKLTKVLERLGVIQRSTVGYKALKLMKLIKGEGRSPSGPKS